MAILMLTKKDGGYKSLNIPRWQEIINNLFETMYNAHGVGLAAPQMRFFNSPVCN
jgi:peptide deformylase